MAVFDTLLLKGNRLARMDEYPRPVSLVYTEAYSLELFQGVAIVVLKSLHLSTHLVLAQSSLLTLLPSLFHSQINALALYLSILQPNDVNQFEVKYVALNLD